MLNQFYKYITGLVIDYFKDNQLRSGDRFYLQLDKEEDVIGLFDELRTNSQFNALPFSYTHKHSEEPFETYCIEINGTKLVLATTLNGVKPDFLVLLRNLVGEQKDDWKDTALLSIVTEQLDSIQGGSRDLQREGLPLHPNSIVKNLKLKMEETFAKDVTKTILLDRMESILEEQIIQQITFFDFEEIFVILNQGEMYDEDYKKLSIFKDPDLTTLKGSKLKERLHLNKELFDYVKRVHDLGNDENDLDNKFTNKLTPKLKQDDWQSTPFTDVAKSYFDRIDELRGNKLILKEVDVKDSLVIWNRVQNETAAGKRKRHIIVFNTKELDEIEMNFNFQLEGQNVKSLNEKFLVIPNKFIEFATYKVGTKKITFNIHAQKNTPTYLKFTYKHDSKAALGVEINLIILPFEPNNLENYQTSYLLNPLLGQIELYYEGNELIFGQGFNKKRIDLNGNNEAISFENDEQIVVNPLPEAFNEEDELDFIIKFIEFETDIKFLLKNDIPESIPINGFRIWKLKREEQLDFILRNNKLQFGNREFYLNKNSKRQFEWESKWINEGFQAAVLDSDELISEDLKINDDLREAYSRFITYFRRKENIPSLCYFSKELSKRANEYVNAYINEINSFPEGEAIGSKGRDLSKLGTIKGKDIIYFTPFHPLMVAFQLKINDVLKSEIVDNVILNRLNPNGLLPFIYSKNNSLYRPDNISDNNEWLSYKPVSQVSVADANQYMAKVVEDKVKQFEEHFSYLLHERSNAPIRINIINIKNDFEVLRGLVNWLLKKINKVGLTNLKNLEVSIYNEALTESSFNLLSTIENPDQFEAWLNIKLKANENDPRDLMRVIRDSIIFYKKDINEEINYGHISFYKMLAQEHDALQPMNEMITGMNLEGLYSTIPSMKGKENYRTGFGTKCYSISDQDVLGEVSYYLNELSANLTNDGNNAYHKGEAIVSRTSTTDEDFLAKILKSSHWVTFVDPTIDLEYFNKMDNIVIIHYSDQYSSSSRFDAITVTNKSQQYFSVVSEFLKEKEVEGTDQNVFNAVNAFNTFNGEWLLRIIGSKGQYSREKLSIISAIKYSLSYFSHPDILWVPISLEEILRVAGAVGLSKSDGVFTAKNLGFSGAHSDDLLLIGLENKDNNLAFHFYPIEVKIGINNSSVIKKAHTQVNQTKKVINDTLISSDSNSFTTKFYRNFFAQLFLSSAQKIYTSDFFSTKDYNLSDEIVEKIIKNDYTISNNLTPYIGECAILSFEKDAYIRTSKLEDGVTVLKLVEADGYRGLVTSIDEMHEWIQNKESDFVRESLLSYKYNSQDIPTDEKTKLYQEKTDEEKMKYDSKRMLGLEPQTETEHVSVPIPVPVGETTQVQDTSTKPEEDSINHKESSDEEIEATNDLTKSDKYPKLVNQDIPINLIPMTEPDTKISSIEEARIYLGKAENSNRKVYWEYGNKGLANRHLLIAGTSGQGKTYFMQCLLLELSKLGISNVVVDYTEGFLPNQLEPEFVGALGEKLRQKIVYSEQFPVNPFSKNVRDIGGISLPESNTDIAERVKSVFGAVYKSLGIQQLNAIYDSILNGLEKYGDKMNLRALKECLEELDTPPSKTALSQIRPLIDRNPFTFDESFSWNNILEDKGTVFVIQLTGYPRDVQLMITEFILWDLWNYSVRSGNKNNPIPVIMDEAQNLDHTEQSPSARILTEGRKFGWSAWYATQFLKSQLSPDELARLQNASQKIFFLPPEQEISTVANSLSNDSSEKKSWESKLSSLRKGQCVVQGPVLKDNNELTQSIVTVVNIAPLSERK
ncbi:DNA phosphorothioation-dependent restriction protein DptH [Bacillus sp. FJAT-25509]|uniref:DNA phosphorothioation-dependent restriction protein DptH n=1 Tax=Bacillus sp. FJAT-25509 TaxID=1712029 RepID=UPI0006F49C08|nr:DNA phosphorothioation-dependent restriction protein DptH [Bacillus sp. FJAT-25509]KQL33524.1 DNA phosphorothioation-dependent restriction protein DptH [Bacillus sp. FJAT-25509]